MKIGIIGAGAVGAACAMATLMRGVASELVIVNRGRDRAKGMATDMGYGPLCRRPPKCWMVTIRT
jgi:L-lactate dehydrogenase